MTQQPSSQSKGDIDRYTVWTHGFDAVEIVANGSASAAQDFAEANSLAKGSQIYVRRIIAAPGPHRFVMGERWVRRDDL